MIRREVMEALYPDFVRKLDEELALVNSGCRELMLENSPPRRKQPNQFTAPQELIRPVIMTLLGQYGAMTLNDLYERLKDRWAYHTVYNNLYALYYKDILVKPARGLYQIKEAP